jgi:hypothetical protein
VHHLDASAGLEQLDRVVGQAAGAAGAEVELAGISLGIGYELSQRLPSWAIVAGIVIARQWLLTTCVSFLVLVTVNELYVRWLEPLAEH